MSRARSTIVNSVQQLPLEISPSPAPSFDNFLPIGNEEAVARVRALSEGALPEAIVYVWGDPGSGRSHLLAAAAAANPELVIADDVEALDPDAQQALFNAINAARDGASPVLAAGSAPPAQLPLREDLRTRLAWGLVYQLHGLSDADKAAHLQAEARRRGLTLSDDLVGYLLTRMPRDLYSLNALLDRLDRHALARQRPLTIALVREVLQSNTGPSGPGS